MILFLQKNLGLETFRKYPIKNEENWVCTNYDNINNSSVF